MGQSTEELSSEIADTRRSLSTDLDALQERVSPSAIVERRKAAARGKVRSVRDRVMGTVHDVRDSAVDAAQSTADSVQDSAGATSRTASDRVQGAPLAAGLVAFGTGMVVAAMLPAADREARGAGKLVAAVKEQAQPLVDEAKAAGQDVAQRLGDSAGEAAQEVKDTAAGSAERVRAQGESAAGSVRSEAGG